MTFGEKAFERLQTEAAILGRKLTATEIKAHLTKVFEEATAKKKSVPISKMTEAEFVAWLEAEPSLAGIDIRKEIGRCQFHWKAKDVTPSRARIVNWFKKVERPIIGNYAGASSAVRAAADKRKEPPHGWREYMKARIALWEGQHPGYEPPGKYELEKLDEFYRMPKSWQDDAWKELGS